MKKKSEELDLSVESAFARNALSKYNNYVDQGGKGAKAERDALQRVFDIAAAEIKDRREALLAAIGE